MKRYDLNLLAALDALLREKTVSAAAARLGVGQPAMSAALSRLRLLLDDPVLVRTPRGMEATERARAIAEPLRKALSELRAVVEPPQEFEPATAKRTFRLSGGDYVGMTVLPELATLLERVAPNIDLRFRYIEKDRVAACLDDDEIDLALNAMLQLPQRFRSETLFDETFVCIARAGHRLLDAPPSAQEFAACNHLLVTERGDEAGAVDQELAKLGLSRRIALTVPSAALVGDILPQTDMVATVGSRAATRLTATGTIVSIPVPFPMQTWTMSMIWPERNSRDQGLVWLRQQMKNAAASIREGVTR